MRTLETATMPDPERAQLHTRHRTPAVEQALKALGELRGRMCDDPACIRAATGFRRSLTGAGVSYFCSVHLARTPLARRQAQLDEARRK